ncbi:MAG: hypothetical protein JZU60_01990 [Ilumatobacteraceae bacterium]|jgi:hypothetical protein|nr:hypothetical protein [Ilumatobacteraceae bacterium]
MSKQREAQILVFSALSVVATAGTYYAVTVGWIHLEEHALTLIEIVTGSLVAGVAVGMLYGIWRDKHDPAAEEHADVMNAMYDFREIPNEIWDRAIKKNADGQMSWRDGWNMYRVIVEFEIKKGVE